MMISKYYFIAAFLLPANFSAAQGADTTEDYETSSEIASDPEKITPVPNDDQTSREQPKSPETFMPSEDISEDIAVSFPVDI
tara:strand:- start:212 stop:457 length:246 start_codon:yes stop_codon:yes gene_type:complete